MGNRKIIIVIVAFLMWLQGFAQVQLLRSGNNGSITLRFDVSKLNFTNSSLNGYVVPEFKDGTTLQIKGAPDLKKITATFIIPDAAKMKFKVVNAEFTDYENVNIAPSKGIITRDKDPESIPYVFGKEYSLNTFFPGKLAELKTPFIQRNLRGQTIWVYPLQYNPVTKVLRVYTKLEIEIYPDGLDSRNVLTASMKKKTVTPGIQQIFEKTFINYNQSKYTPIEEGHPGRMLVICYDGFLGDIQPFVDWKKQKGIEVDVVSVSSIGNNATDIKNYVQNYYDTHSDFSYLLIVGDAPQVTSSSTSAGDSDNEYGYLAGNDHRIDVFVGRFSAETNADVQTEVERTIFYERDIHSDAAWLNFGLGIASDEGTGGQGDDGESDAQHMDNIKTDLQNYGYTINSVYQGTGANADDISNYVNTGLGIINYVGHGDVTMWYSVDPNGFTNDHVNALTNSYKLPFIWTVACVVGNFVNNTCFAEAWIRATDDGGNPTGAVIDIGSTINQSWASPMDAQDEMVDILVETYPNNLKRTYGGLIANGWGHMIDEYGSDGENMADTWTCFGDPSIMVRTKQPDTMIVTHSDSIIQGVSGFNVSCDVEDALVSITHNNEILGVGYVNGGSVYVDFQSPITFSDSVLVTVTAYNRVTYQKYVPVKISTDPPVAAFYADPLVITQGEYVQFYDTSLNYPNSWNWYFEGAETTNSTLQNPNIQYMTPGTYDVKLVVSNPNGTDSIIKTDYITVNPVTDPPVADFEADVTTITTGESVNFTDLSTNLPDSWSWTFDGGTPAASTDQNPQGIVYNTPGTYTVTLVASNSFGSDTAVKVNYITVLPPSYCDAEATTEYEYISNVTIGSDVNNNSAWDGYGDYTNYVANTVQGGQLSVTVSIGNLYDTDVLYAWVDWNYDGDFDDTGELVYSNDNNQSTYTFTVNVPSNAAIATTRMRIRLNDANEDPQTLPCGSTSYGDVEDYSINISQAVGNEQPIVGNVSIYPNPTKGLIYVNSASAGNYEIFDVAGNVVLSGKISGNGFIDLTGLPEGFYFLKMGDKIFKVVKQ